MLEYEYLPEVITNLLRNILLERAREYCSDSGNVEYRCWNLEKDPQFSQHLKPYLEDCLVKASKFYRSHTLRYTLMGNVVPSGIEVGSGGGWHNDSRITKQIKYFIYLSDVKSPEDGAFEFIPSLPSVLFTAIFALFNRGSPRYSDRFTPLLQQYSRHILAPAGTLFSMDTRVIHRGNPVDENRLPRVALTLYVYGRTVPGNIDLTSISFAKEF